MHATKVLVLIGLAIVARRFVDWPFLEPVTLALVGFLIVTFAWSRLSLRSVSLTRSVSADKLQVGQILKDRIEITNTSRFAKLWIEVLDYSTLPGHSASRVVRVSGEGQTDWTQETVCTRRGEYRTGPAMLHSGDPFGIFPISKRMHLTRRVLVYPATVNVAGYTLPAGQLMGSNSLSRRNPFVTPSVAGVREYVHGDALNRISWSTSARLGRLMVKEFELDPTADVWIVLDLERVHHRNGTGGEVTPRETRASAPWLDSTEEYAVTIAASLARMALEDGRSVGLIASASHQIVLTPDRSERQLRRVLEHLAAVGADGHRPLHEVLTSESFRFRRQSAVLVVTPSSNEWWTHALAAITSRRVPCAAIVVEASTFDTAESALPVVGGLLAHGIQTHLVKFGDDITTVLATHAGVAVGPEFARSDARRG